MVKRATIRRSMCACSSGVSETWKKQLEQINICSYCFLLLWNSLHTTVQQGESNARGLAEIPQDPRGDVAHVCGFGVPDVTAAAPNQLVTPSHVHRTLKRVQGIKLLGLYKS